MNKRCLDQIFINYLYRNTQPRTCFKTNDRAFQTFGQAFEALRENQKLGRVFIKLDRLFVL